MVIAYHIILTGYGHWLPNDVRGSLSHEVHSPRLAQAAEVHHGRKAEQPSPQELRAFHKEADARLHYPVLWWDSAERQALADAFGGVMEKEALTCYSCAVLRNHVHLLVRKHRWKAEDMSASLRDAGREALARAGAAMAGHPVFSADSCHIYKSTPAEVRNCIEYILGNYRKHGLPPCSSPWVIPYDGWPLHRR